MFLGHFGVGFGAKAAAPRTSLGSLFLAAQFVDLLWPTLLLLGWEQVRILPHATQGPPLEFVSYPISHSLLSVVGWGVVGALLYQLVRRYPRGAVVIGAGVVSHYLLDLLVHFPDLPLYPGGPQRLGLGLWSSLWGSLALELGIFAIGVAVYLRTTRAIDRTGTFALWGLVLFLMLIQVGNVFGAPPPSVTALAWVGQAQWLFVVWGYWVDSHRSPRFSAGCP